MPVVTSVSQATRERMSCSSSASRIASDTWSATLSGWPSETDFRGEQVIHKRDSRLI